MKLVISYVLKGQYVNKVVLLRSLDRVLAAAEGAGAQAITVTKVS